MTPTEVWPSIPLPYCDFSVEPRNATVADDPEGSIHNRRSRFEKAYGTINVQWIFDSTQYAAFRTFVQTNLGNAAAAFKIELRYPKNSALSWWAVRLDPSFTAAYNEGHWTVEGALDLIQTTS